MRAVEKELREHTKDAMLTHSLFRGCCDCGVVTSTSSSRKTNSEVIPSSTATTRARTKTKRKMVKITSAVARILLQVAVASSILIGRSSKNTSLPCMSETKYFATYLKPVFPNTRWCYYSHMEHVTCFGRIGTEIFSIWKLSMSNHSLLLFFCLE